MKKNPGRKMARAEKRRNTQLLKIKMKNMENFKRGKGTEPHPNAIEANRIREEKMNEAIDRKETFDMIFRQETKFGKQWLEEQKERLARRKKWLKEKGLV